jgi:PKD repeat protein
MKTELSYSPPFWQAEIRRHRICVIPIRISAVILTTSIMKKTFTRDTRKVFVLAMACSTLLLNQVYAQSQQLQEEKHCGQQIKLDALYARYPGMQSEVEMKQQQSWTEGKANLENNRDLTPPTYIIPVVFHIIHDYGVENISDAQVLDEMMCLNRDYRKQNTDTAALVQPFPGLAADTKIEFRLAHLDPNGNCTNGIEHIASMETYVGDDGSKLNQWPRDKYLNVWVVKSMEDGIAGYAYFPAAADGFFYPFDGVIMLQDYCGSIGTSIPSHSRTLTHEVGHYLSLHHIWGDTPCGTVCGDDGILDTPVTKGWLTCPTPATAKICDTAVVENYQNYMDYSYCTMMFTYGQKAAMTYALNSSIADRSNLWQPSNLAATGCLTVQPICKPIADFDANRTMVCEGGAVTLTDLSHSSAGTAWQWILAGPVTLTSSLQNPTFTNLSPGTYNATLVATNATGADTLTKTNYILVSADQSALTAQYSEGFENPNVFSLGYVANDRYGNGSIFHRSTSAAYTGTGSACLNNYGQSLAGDVDELITPSYYLSYVSNLQFSFQYSYATASTSAALNTQTLKVYSSTDCGQTWTVRWTRLGSALVIGGYTPFFYAPTAQSDWDYVTINLPSSLAQPNVRFKFEFTSPGDNIANNLYIDDINILGTNVGINENSSDAGFTVYPNPGDGNGTIAYSLNEQAPVQCDIFDLAGRVVRSVEQGEQSAGNYTMSVSDATAPLATGTYMIRMTIGDKVTTRKYVVTAQH